MTFGLSAAAMVRAAPTALIVGGSRGIGAAVARRLAARGYAQMITYRNHRRRALDVAASIAPGWTEVLQVDITDPSDIERLVRHVRNVFGGLDLLVICASGGLEKDRDADYAHRINTEAPQQIMRAIARVMRPKGSVIYLTSHEAHFHRGGGYAPYRRIAATKQAGEQALLEDLPMLAQLGLTLKIVSADLVVDSATAKLLERDDPGHSERRRREVGRLPTSDDVAGEVVARAEAASPSGEVTFVWQPGARYLSEGQAADAEM